MACAICQTRRPRRFCPGVRGDICTVCCGTEREVSVTCPLDCEYLQEVRKHEKPAWVEGAAVPNEEIQVSEQFLHENAVLLNYLAQVIGRAALETPGVVDFDIREGLEGLIRTYRTLQSGVYYESRPTNPLAAAIFDAVKGFMPEFQRMEQERLGLTKTREADVLRCLTFLQRLELARNNGRRRGRAFLDALTQFYGDAPEPEAPPASSLLLP